MKVHGFSNAAERAEKKQLAQEINKIINKNRYTYKNLKNILHISTHQINVLKKMELGKFSVKSLTEMLEKLSEVSDE
jgi:predicted XRE-type DNA-binding protein